LAFLGGKNGTTISVPALKWMDKNTAWYMNGKDVMLATLDGVKMRWSTTKLMSLPADADHVTIDKSHRIAYTIQNNLWLSGMQKREIFR
jgi:hypothetical protein